MKSLMRSAALTPFCTLKLMSTFTSVKESVNLMMGTWKGGEAKLEHVTETAWPGPGREGDQT